MSAETDLLQHYNSDPRTTEELIQIAHDSDLEVADGPYWEAVRVLQHRLPTIFDRIRTLGGNDRARELAATILGQNSVKDKVFLSECADVLLGMLATESSEQVIISIAQALGHLRDPRAVEAIVPLRTHHDPGVRLAIAFGLHFQEAPMAISALIQLASDVDRDVRSWATFGLGQCDADSPALREALALRLSEQDEEIRGEALSGLARRCDRRVLAPIIAEIEVCVNERRRLFPLVADAAEAIIKCPELRTDTGWADAVRKLKSAGLAQFLEWNETEDRDDELKILDVIRAE